MQRVHLGVFPAKGSGHINPMLELSRYLIPVGFTVSFILTEADYTSRMKSKDDDEDGIQFVCIPNPQHGSLTTASELQEQTASVLKALSSPVQFIVSDFFLGWTQDLANSLGVPRIAFVTCSAAAQELCYYIPLLDSKGFIPANDQLEDGNLITFLPHIEPFHPRQLPMAFRLSKEKSLALGKQLQRMDEALCVLVNTVEELEQNVVSRQRLHFKNYLPIGPLIPDATLVSRNSCIDWLDKQTPKSVLYIAFGSVSNLPADKVKMIAEALKATGEPFLWAIRRDFMKDEPESVYENIRTGFGHQGLVVEWAPQMHVLQHSAVSAFFTHCGWNSTMEAVCSGVPTLCWPCGAEQNTNSSTMVRKWKTGVEVAEGTGEGVTAEDIVKKIKLVMESAEGGEMRSRAEKLKAIADGTYEGSCSKRNLQRFREILLWANCSQGTFQSISQIRYQRYRGDKEISPKHSSINPTTKSFK